MPEPAPASRIIVSFRVGLALALANVVCAGIIAYAWVQTRARDEVVTVTGSAKERIASDLIVWRGSVTARREDLQEAYKVLQEGVTKARAFLAENGVTAQEMVIGPVHTQTFYARDSKGRDTDKISSYSLRQPIDIISSRVLAVAELSRKATQLIEQGVLFESDAPQFMYTKLADLKIEMLAKATKDATTRAREICQNSGSQLGKLRSARMGVMQITPAFSNEVSDYGMNDTTSFEKDVRGVVTASFAVER